MLFLLPGQKECAYNRGIKNAPQTTPINILLVLLEESLLSFVCAWEFSSLISGGMVIKTNQPEVKQANKDGV